MHRFAIVALVGLVTALPISAQQDFSSVEIRVQEVAAGVYMLTGSGGNMVVSVGDDGAFLIDDQYAPLSDKILAAIRGITSQPVRFVFNTHWHQDHTGGNENIGGTGALIVAHENVRQRMSVDQAITYAGRRMEFPASPPTALPVVTFSEDVTFHLNGDELHAFHVEHAHTDGDAIVRFVNANVVHMGDTFEQGAFPFIDIDSGGSIDGMIAAVDAALPLMDGNTKVVPGHGAVSTRAGLVDYVDGLRAMRNAVAELVLEGHPLDHILDFRPIQEQAEALGHSRSVEDAFVEAIYNGLAVR